MRNPPGPRGAPPLTTPTRPRHHLSTADAVSIVVGIIVGAFIFKAPSTVFAGAGSVWAGLTLWLVGGALSLLGALCYAELACTYPGPAGDYGFLSRVLGRRVGVLFAWAQLAVIRSGAGIGVVAYIFAEHAELVLPLAGWLRLIGGAGLADHAKTIWVIAVVLALTGVNALGVQTGKWTQHALNAVKVVGLSGVVLAGAVLAFTSPVDVAPSVSKPSEAESVLQGLSIAMVYVLLTYGGWNEAAYITAELRDPRRETVWVLVIGVSIVIGIYFVVNLAYLAGLGYAGVCANETVAAALLERALGPGGKLAMSLLVIVSALGGLQGLVFTGPRLYGSFASGHPLFARLRPKPEEATSLAALLTQAAFVVGLVLVAGLSVGGGDGFQSLVDCTAPVFWTFFLLVGLTLPLSRLREPQRERPFRVPGYPVVPVLFCLASGFMLWQSTVYALGKRPTEMLLVGVLLLPGLFLALTAGPAQARREEP